MLNMKDFEFFYNYVAVEYVIRLLDVIPTEGKNELEVHLHIKWGRRLEPTIHMLYMEHFPGKLIKTLVSWTLELPG